MANEKRLIDADELVDSLRDELEHDCNRYNYWTDKLERDSKYHFAIDQIANAPTVDAVEVVRCKDCKWWSRNVGIVDSPNGHCFSHDIDPNGYDFCSYGERKDNA